MSASLSDSSPHRSHSFQLILDSFCTSSGLPFSQILSADRIDKVFARHNGIFGTQHIYSTSDTGDYCKARAKLSMAALRELSCEVAAEVESSADDKWLWKGRHAKLVDGFTLTMPDTQSNQEQFPQVKTQAPGVGFPIARVVAIVSLATACVMDLSMGPYAGKQTGENGLLRSLFESFNQGDIVVFDRNCLIAAMVRF
ncbi:MAG: hypothetical protein JKY95_15795 [Planctomycetaceae bacterium]|nr:hypothetical protein [Planctomycetaceae bacterium]